MTCGLLERGTIELYWYGELSQGERDEARRHLDRCLECRQALHDIEIIAAALAERPEVASPPGGDWSRFMAELSAAVAAEPRPKRTPPAESVTRAGRHRLVPYLASAALLALVTMSVFTLVRGRSATPPADGFRADVAMDVSFEARPPSLPDPALVSLSDQHFQRSKLVLLGLTTRDTAAPAAEDWEYERDLAATLLQDTRLYRRAVEEHGMTGLADVLRDLEMVLLQTSMSEGPDRESLEGIQRLIRRRDLLTRMSVVHAGGF